MGKGEDEFGVDNSELFGKEEKAKMKKKESHCKENDNSYVMQGMNFFF